MHTRNNTKKSNKLIEQKAVQEEKTTQTDNESAQFGQDLADLDALSQKNDKEGKIAMIIKRQSILSEHIRKLSKENSQLKVEMKNNNNRLKGMLNAFTQIRTTNTQDLAFIKAELKASAVSIKHQEKDVHRKMKELGEYYEKEKKVFMDKLAKKDVQMGKYKDQIKELSKLKEKAFAALEMSQRNLQAARSDSFISYQKEKEAIKNLNDRLYLAENERCKNCKLVEEKRAIITDRISTEMVNLKMDVEKKDNDIIEKDRIINILTEKMEKLKKEKKDADEAKKKAEFSANTYRNQFQKCEANLNLFKQKYSPLSSTGTSPTEEEISLVHILTPPDDNERTNNGKGQPSNSSKSSNAQIQTIQSKTQNVAIKSKKRSFAKSINNEGEIKPNNGNEQNKNCLEMETSDVAKVGGLNKDQEIGRKDPLMTSTQNKINLNYNQTERPNIRKKNKNIVMNEEPLEDGELDKNISPSIASIHSNSPKPKKQKQNIARIGGAHRLSLSGALSFQQSLRMSSSSTASNPKQTGAAKIQQPADPWRISPYSNTVQNHQQQHVRPTSSTGYQIPTSQNIQHVSSNADIYQRCSGATIDDIDFWNDVEVEEFESGNYKREAAFIEGVMFARRNNSSQIGSISAANLDNIQGQGNGDSSWRVTHVIAPCSNTMGGPQMIECVNHNQPMDGQYFVRRALPAMYERQQSFQQISSRQNIPRPPVRHSVPIPSTSQFSHVLPVPSNVLPWHVQNANPNIGRFFNI